MDRVIEDCQTTFEEDGVNQQTLEDLKSVGGSSFPSIVHRFVIYHSLSSP